MHPEIVYYCKCTLPYCGVLEMHLNPKINTLKHRENPNFIRFQCENTGVFPRVITCYIWLFDAFTYWLDFYLKTLLFILTVRLCVLVYVVMYLSDYVMTYDYIYCDVIRWFYFAKTVKRIGRTRWKEGKMDLGKMV